MKLVKYHIASISIILILLMTNVIEVLTAPVEPLYEVTPECYSSRECIDPQWKACVEECLNEYQPDVAEECGECFKHILVETAIAAGTIVLVSLPGGAVLYLAKVIWLEFVEGTELVRHLMLVIDCTECSEVSNELLSCMANCQCSQWRNVEVCICT